MDRETTDDLVLLWAKAYLDIVFVLLDTVHLTANAFGAEIRERTMMNEIEDHLRRVAH